MNVDSKTIAFFFIWHFEVKGKKKKTECGFSLLPLVISVEKTSLLSYNQNILYAAMKQ